MVKESLLQWTRFTHSKLCFKQAIEPQQGAGCFDTLHLFFELLFRMNGAFVARLVIPSEIQLKGTRI